MSRFWAGLIAAVLTASTVSAAPPVVYAAVRAAKDQQITLRAWGSGSIAETDEMAYEGTHSIRISTRNFFQGGLIALGSPVDLSTSFEDKNNLLRFMLSVPTASTTFTSGGPGGKGAGAAGGPGARGRGAGGAGGGRQGGPGGAGGAPQGLGGLAGGGRQGTQQEVVKLKTVRVLITTTDGKRSEAYVPLPSGKAKDGTFVQLAVPIQAISGFDKTNKIVKEIGLAGDVVSTFYVGNIAVINDATPISGDMNHSDLNLALGEKIDFSAVGYGGASILVYSWNFGLNEGAAEPDAVGQFVTRKFRKPGDFVVTLTISDKFGLKAPYKTSIKVRVNP